MQNNGKSIHYYILYFNIWCSLLVLGRLCRHAGVLYLCDPCDLPPQGADCQSWGKAASQPQDYISPSTWECKEWPAQIEVHVHRHPDTMVVIKWYPLILLNASVLIRVCLVVYQPDCDALWSLSPFQFSAPAGWSSPPGLWNSRFSASACEPVPSRRSSLSDQILATTRSPLYLPALRLWLESQSLDTCWKLCCQGWGYSDRQPISSLIWHCLHWF